FERDRDPRHRRWASPAPGVHGVQAQVHDVRESRRARAQGPQTRRQHRAVRRRQAVPRAVACERAPQRRARRRSAADRARHRSDAARQRPQVGELGRHRAARARPARQHRRDRGAAARRELHRRDRRAAVRSGAAPGRLAAAPTPADRRGVTVLWVARMVEERFHRDDEDRPIREGRTPPEHLKPGEIEYKPCAYAGTRRGRLMNVSALRQAAAHWDEILATQALLRVAYAEARGSYGPDVMDLWRVSQLGSALPWFSILPGGVVPAYVASLAKVTLGMGLLAQRMLARSLAEGWVAPALTTQSLL